MAQITSTGPGENEVQAENMSATSHTKKFRKKGSQDISQETRLRILQQAAFDYQAAGGQFELIAYSDEHGNPALAIVLLCMASDEHGNFVPCMHGNE